MTKYKIVGIINFFLGVPVLLLSLALAIFVIPKLNQLYTEFNAGTSGNTFASYLVVLVLLIVATPNIFLAVKSFSNTPKKESYFKYGLIAAAITFLLGGLLIGFMTLSVMFPIYSLTSQF